MGVLAEDLDERRVAFGSHLGDMLTECLQGPAVGEARSRGRETGVALFGLTHAAGYSAVAASVCAGASIGGWAARLWASRWEARR